jgi:hypothetical protein
MNCMCIFILNLVKTPALDKSSHGLWPGELMNIIIILCMEPIYIWVHICRKLIWICLNLHPTIKVLLNKPHWISVHTLIYINHLFMKLLSFQKICFYAHYWLTRKYMNCMCIFILNLVKTPALETGNSP